MSAYVLDTSVAMAWYLSESFESAAREWQRRALAGKLRLLVSGLHFWEVANVLRTYVRRGDLSPEVASEIYSLHLDAPLEVIDPERAGVLATALELGATAYDAVFIALAREQQAPLLTAERATTPWVAALGELAVTI